MISHVETENQRYLQIGNKSRIPMFRNYPDAFGVDILCQVLGGISKKLAYRLLAENEIAAIRVGRSYVISKAAVIDYLISDRLCHIEVC